MSHKYKFVFVHIPKTGGSSVFNLSPVGGVPNTGYLKGYIEALDGVFQHMHPEATRGYGYFTWTIIRNPFDRFISIYHSISRHHHRDWDFDEFFEFFKKHKFSKGAVYLPQKYWTHSLKTGECLIDKFLIFDNIENEVVALLKELGINPPRSFPHARKSHGRKHWMSYYTKEQLDHIKKVYSDDFDIYYGLIKEKENEQVS